MTFLKALVPLLPTAASFQVHLSNKDGKLNLLLLPQLAPAQDDEDPGVAAFRAVLASAVKIEVPADADPDTYVVGALSDLAAVRGETVSELDAYRAALAAAKEAAKAADDARRKEATKKAPVKPAKATKGAAATTAAASAATTAAASASAAQEPAQDEEDGTDESSEAGATDAVSEAADAAADAPAAAPPPPAASATTDLFSSLGL